MQFGEHIVKMLDIWTARDRLSSGPGTYGCTVEAAFVCVVM